VTPKFTIAQIFSAPRIPVFNKAVHCVKRPVARQHKIGIPGGVFLPVTNAQLAGNIASLIRSITE